ncbi:MAG: UDP-N-acetylmuramoyl-tripeptide--D-alanyl-D-alanine ligase [Anaerolineales bacterium]|nr:UDP-N-acetylmuramoyl-tripeptide--D-alanyl-D-alanine ligase [Anaerolineales bacterium]
MLTLGLVIEALTGYQAAGGPQIITDVASDSRLSIPGSLFVALPGERTDGHFYVSAAFARGAIAAVVQRDLPADFPVLDLREPLTFERAAAVAAPICLRVPDTLQALQTLGAFWRRRLDVRVIGVTGSVGKTTSKELIAAVLGTRYRTFKTEGNYNNEIGLPLMLLKLTEAHERAVLEMGFYQVGEIAQLCAWARPHVAVVNNVYPVHLERAGSLEAIVQGKGELVAALPADGVAILNLDDPRVMAMRARTRARTFTYGLDPAADLWADHIEGRGLAGVHFHLHHGRETLHLRVPLLGQHSVHTALRAAAVGLVEGLTWEEIVAGLQSIGAVQLRLAAVRGPGGSLLIDDTYNASPESTIAALNLLSEIEGRKVAVLGDMLELGGFEAAGHRLVGQRAGAVAEVLVTIGPRARLIADEARQAGLPAAAVAEFETGEAALPFLQALIQAGDVVLLKGSRGLRLDRLARALEAGA